MNELLNTDQAAEFLSKPAATLSRWRFEGVGPPFIKLGKAGRYKREDLEAFIEVNRVEPERVGQ